MDFEPTTSPSTLHLTLKSERGANKTRAHWQLVQEGLCQ